MTRARWSPLPEPQRGRLVNSFNALVGATGAVTLMRFTDGLGPVSLAVMPTIAVPLLLTIGLAHVTPMVFMGLTAFMYLLLGGSHYRIQSILGVYYPTGDRARGAGWDSSIGNMGSVAAPLLGTWLLTYHVGRSP